MLQKPRHYKPTPARTRKPKINDICIVAYVHSRQQINNLLAFPARRAGLNQVADGIQPLAMPLEKTRTFDGLPAQDTWFAERMRPRTHSNTQVTQPKPGEISIEPQQMIHLETANSIQGTDNMHV